MVWCNRSPHPCARTTPNINEQKLYDRQIRCCTNETHLFVLFILIYLHNNTQHNIVQIQHSNFKVDFCKKGMHTKKG